MNYKAITFDYDGTLVDTYDFHVTVIRQALNNCGAGISRSDMEKIVRLSLRAIFEAALPPERVNDAPKALLALYEKPSDDFWSSLSVVDHARETLSAIRKAGIKTGLVTNSHQKLVTASLAHFGFTDLFDAVQASDEDAYTKEERMQTLLQELQVSPEETLYIGDTAGDIIDAQHVGMDNCLISGPAAWIHKDPGALETLSPDFIITDLKEILKIAGLSEC